MTDMILAGTGSVLLERAAYDEIVSVLQTIYAGGYVNNRMTFEDKKALRAKSYRVLKKLGVEK